MTTSPVMGITEEILGEIERVSWKLVPIEPTPEMLAATSWPGCAGADYAKMVSAAPAAPVAEVERLIDCLKRANSQAEHFERERYLRGDEIERLERINRYLVRTYIVSDDSYSPEAETDRAISRIKARFS